MHPQDHHIGEPIKKYHMSVSPEENCMFTDFELHFPFTHDRGYSSYYALQSFVPWTCCKDWLFTIVIRAFKANQYWPHPEIWCFSETSSSGWVPWSNIGPWKECVGRAAPEWFLIKNSCKVGWVGRAFTKRAPHGCRRPPHAQTLSENGLSGTICIFKNLRYFSDDLVLVCHHEEANFLYNFWISA